MTVDFQSFIVYNGHAGRTYQILRIYIYIARKHASPSQQTGNQVKRNFVHLFSQASATTVTITMHAPLIPVVSLAPPPLRNQCLRQSMQGFFPVVAPANWTPFSYCFNELHNLRCEHSTQLLSRETYYTAWTHKKGHKQVIKMHHRNQKDVGWQWQTDKIHKQGLQHHACTIPHNHGMHPYISSCKPNLHGYTDVHACRHQQDLVLHSCKQKCYFKLPHVNRYTACKNKLVTVVLTLDWLLEMCSVGVLY